MSASVSTKCAAVTSKLRPITRRRRSLLLRAALTPAKRINTTHYHMIIKPVGVKVTNMIPRNVDPDALFGGEAGVFHKILTNLHSVYFYFLTILVQTEDKPTTRISIRCVHPFILK